MGIFNLNLDKEGPGVPKDQPPKRGLFRLWELLTREFLVLLRLGILAALGTLPGQLLLGLAFQHLLEGRVHTALWLLLFGLLLSIPAGALMTAGSRILSSMVRDDPGFFWHDFKKSFRDSFRQSLAFGLLYNLLMGLYLPLFFVALQRGSGVLPFFMGSLLVFYMLYPYYYLQAAYLDLGPLGLLKNSLMLAASQIPRTLASAACLLAGWVVSLYWFPYSVLPYLLLGYSLPGLISVLFLWPGVDRAFGIQEELEQRLHRPDASDNLD